MLTDPENYSTVEKEALAVVWPVDKFRTYLEDAEVVVISSDCQALQWLFSIKTRSRENFQMGIEIARDEYGSRLYSGKSNVIADSLSIPLCNNNEDTSCTIRLASKCLQSVLVIFDARN